MCNMASSFNGSIAALTIIAKSPGYSKAPGAH